VFRFLPLLLLCNGLKSQTVEIPPAGVDRGGTNIFRILFKSNPGRPVIGLQWELVYADSLQMEASGVVPGDQAETAGKTIVCKPAAPRGTENVLRCLIVGGASALSTGTIAIVRFSAPSKAPKGKARIALETVVGVAASTDRVDLEGATGEITIR
jgi:hypothetical protein